MLISCRCLPALTKTSRCLRGANVRGNLECVVHRDDCVDHRRWARVAHRVPAVVTTIGAEHAEQGGAATPLMNL
jgi:hypothetical protein